jgi:hypothetical protein
MDESTSDLATILATYADGPNRLEAALAGLSAAEIDLAERDGAWTIRQIAHHVADGDALWTGFVKQAIGDPGGRFDLHWYWQIPQDEWARRWAYARREIEPSLALFRANRAQIVQLLTSIPEAWQRSLLVRWSRGEEELVSVAWVVDMQAGHVLGHAEDIRRARQAHGL